MRNKSLQLLLKHRLASPEILNALPDGVYITDTRRNILFWNQAAERITGWAPKEILGRSCFDNILVHEDKDGHKLCGEEYCPLHRSIVTGRPSDVPLLVYAQHCSGTRVPVEVSVAPIRDTKGTIVGGIELFRDLTASVEDLIRAKLIQATELHSPLPDDKRVRFSVRYTPNGVVGGDFYRIEPLTDDVYGIMIADVMGHGVAAALYTMQIRSLWEDGRSKLGHPTRFIGWMNQRLHTLAGTAGYFATALYATLNVVTGELVYIQAGHPPPLLIHKKVITPLDNPQPALGMLDAFAYKESRATLQSSGSLLLYTDGAIEILNAAGRELGGQGLIKLIKARPSITLEQLENTLLAYSDDIHLQDDLTLVRIHRPA